VPASWVADKVLHRGSHTVVELALEDDLGAELRLGVDRGLVVAD
jgi:predicted Rdx family selenoprotein